jgi:hypothetical protein
MPDPDVLPLADVTKVIQVALTPVFLLSGIASLLGVFATRLARVADQTDELAQNLEAAAEAGILRQRLDHLRRRSLALDAAVVLATIGGLSTGFAILTLFLGALRREAAGWLLFGTFGFAVACTIGALFAFLAEALIAGRGVRLRIERHGQDM